MKIKIEIKNRFTGKVIFEFETENNTVKKTLIEAVKQGADLQGAYLRGADLQDAYLRGACLQGADLQDAYLRGADLQGAYLRGACLRGANLQGAYLLGVKIKSAIIFTGLYKYAVLPYITEDNVHCVKMGCHDRTVEEWEANFWNNNIEFPNNGDMDSKLRLMAYNTAKEWLKLQENEN